MQGLLFLAVDACETEAKLLLFEILCNYIDLSKFCGPFCVILEGIIPISFIVSSFFFCFFFFSFSFFVLP